MTDYAGSTVVGPVFLCLYTRTESRQARLSLTCSLRVNFSVFNKPSMLKQIIFSFAVLIALPGLAQNGAVEEVEDSDERAYMIVEEMPEFPGGEDAMFKYLAGNIVYPQMAVDSNWTGTVYARFVIDPEGNVTDPRIVRGVHPLLDEETLRVIRKMPAWKPGKQRGKTVPVEYTIPVAFRLE